MDIPKVGGGRAITIRATGWTGQIVNNKGELFDESKHGPDFYQIFDNIESARKYAVEEIRDGMVEVLIYNEHGEYVEVDQSEDLWSSCVNWSCRFA